MLALALAMLVAAGKVFDVLSCGLITRLWTSALFILLALLVLEPFFVSILLKTVLLVRLAGMRRLAQVGRGER